MAHVDDIASVPTREFKRGQATAEFEHTEHVGNIAGVPIREVKHGQATAAAEHIVHSCDIAGVPPRDIERGQTGATPEHISHFGDITGVDIFQIHARAIGEIVEQLCAVAGEAHVAGGGNALYCRGGHIVVPLVCSIELAPQ